MNFLICFRKEIIKHIISVWLFYTYTYTHTPSQPSLSLSLFLTQTHADLKSLFIQIRVVLASFHKRDNRQLHKFITNFATICSLTNLCVKKLSRPHAVLWMLFTEIVHLVTVTKFFPTFLLLRHFEFSVIVHGILALHYYHSENLSMLCHKITMKQTFLAFSMVCSTLDRS